MIEKVMASLVKRKKLLAILPFLESENLYDVVDSDQLTLNPDEMTGFERLRNLFRSHEGHPVHPSLASLGHTFMASLLGGGVIGAFKSSRETFISFIENNEATQFRSHLDAKRKLSDKMILSFGRGFLSLGPRVCLLCTSFTAMQLMLTTYQNKYSFIHHTVSGMAAGALYKTHFGFRGMCAGAFFGGLFGTSFGFLHTLILKISKISEEDLANFKKSRAFKREESIEKAKKDLQIEEQQEEMLGLLSDSFIAKRS